MSILSLKSKSYNVLKLNFKRNKRNCIVHCQHKVHVIIDRQIVYMCETDQMADFHIYSLSSSDDSNLVRFNFGAFLFSVF